LPRLSREVFENLVVPFNPYNLDGNNGLTTNTSPRNQKYTTNPKYKFIRPARFGNRKEGQQDSMPKVHLLIIKLYLEQTN
jgi:hypothetical protein